METSTICKEINLAPADQAKLDLAASLFQEGDGVDGVAHALDSVMPPTKTTAKVMARPGPDLGSYISGVLA